MCSSTSTTASTFKLSSFSLDAECGITTLAFIIQQNRIIEFPRFIFGTSDTRNVGKEMCTHPQIDPELDDWKWNEKSQNKIRKSVWQKILSKKKNKK